MMTQQATPTHARPNKFSGPCSICDTHVRAGAGTLLGKAGAYDLRCHAHANVPPDFVAAKFAAPAPEVSRAAYDVALQAYERARDDADAPAGAREIAWEIVSALAFCRGEKIERARLDASNAPEHAAAAASIVDDLLATRASTSVATNADDVIAEDLGGFPVYHRDYASEQAREQAERMTIETAGSIVNGRTTFVHDARPAPERASKPRASKRADANPFAHRRKQ